MPSSPQELLNAAEGLAAEFTEPLLRAAVSRADYQLDSEVTQAGAFQAVDKAKEIFKLLP